MDQRAAFARARSFLNYHRVAKWSSLAAAVGTAVLYVLLLMLLGLYADLIVNRGEIPAFRRLSDGDQAAFKKEWEEPLSHFPPLSIAETVEKRDLPRKETAALTKTLTQAKSKWQAWLTEWDVKEEKDATTVLRVLQLRLALSDLGLKGDKLDEWTEHCLEAATLPTVYDKEMRVEMLWRFMSTNFSPTGRVKMPASTWPALRGGCREEQSCSDALNRSIADMGILSLVFRTPAPLRQSGSSPCCHGSFPGFTTVVRSLT